MSISRALGYIRPFNPKIIGSASIQSQVAPNDIDVLIAVPDSQVDTVVGDLKSFGFVQGTPDPETTDPMVRSSLKLSYLDIQIANPTGYSRKITVHEFVRKHKLHTDSKSKRYALYRSLYELMN